MPVFRILLILAFGFFAEAAIAGKAYDLLIHHHNNKIKDTTQTNLVTYNDKIHGILGGSRGFSKNYLTAIEKANTTYVAVHALLTTPGTAEEIFLEKVLTDVNLKHLDIPKPKIITHYVKLAILYFATETAGQTNDPIAFKLLIKAKIGELAKAGRLPTSLRTALAGITETEITNALQRLNFGEIYRFGRRQIFQTWRGIAQIELNGKALPSFKRDECAHGRGKCGGKGNWGGMHHPPRPHPEMPPFVTGVGVPPPSPDIGEHGHHGHHRHHHHGPRPFSPPPGMHGPRLPPPPPFMARPHPGHPHGHHWRKEWLKEFSSPTATTSLDADDDE